MADSPLQGADRRNRRAALLMTIIFVLAAGLIGFGAFWYLGNEHARLLRETTQAMSAQSRSKAALLTVWAGSLVDQISHFTSGDMLRLFATEVHDTNIPASVMLRLASEQERRQEDVRSTADSPPSEAPSAPAATTPEPEADAETLAAVQTLAQRVPMMRALLKDFLERAAFWDVCLLNTNIQVYLTPGAGPLIDAARKPFLEECLHSGKPVFMPVRRMGDALVMDLVFPLFAPLYVDNDERVVSLLLITCNVLPIVKAASHQAADDAFATSILQVFDDHLTRLEPDTEEGIVPLPGWELVNAALPAGIRHDPTLDSQVFDLALEVPYLPWLLEQRVPATYLDTLLKGLRKKVLLFAGLVVTLAGVVLAAMWWALVGRNERAVAEQIRHLYQMLFQQKQILDGVNAALPAGVALNDMNGVLFYANQSFADMAGRPVDELRGLQHTALDRPLAHSLVTHTRAVHDSGTPTEFTETLVTPEGEARYYLSSCTPFRDAAGTITGVVSVYNDVTALALAQQRAQHMVAQTVDALVRAIETVDAYLCGQSALTAHLAVLLAVQLGHSDPETLATLRTAANLSQVGMIRLPQGLLTKSGALTAEERQLLQRHVDYAREALEGIDFGLPVLEAITQMYERMDGSGYPAGLKGEAICENARILAVANTFCALMRPRSYRTERTLEDALDILAKTPPQYDPVVVQALRDLIATDEGAAFLCQLRNGNGKQA